MLAEIQVATLSLRPPLALLESEFLDGQLCRLPAPTVTVSVAGTPEGKRVYTGVEDPARGHCWADRP